MSLYGSTVFLSGARYSDHDVLESRTIARLIKMKLTQGKIITQTLLYKRTH